MTTEEFLTELPSPDNEKEEIMGTYWTVGKGIQEKYQEDIEGFIRHYFKGKYKIVCSGIMENTYINYDYYINNEHIASLKGKFSESFMPSKFNVEKWREESIPNEWYWQIAWYWKEMEDKLWQWFGKTRAERYQDDDYFWNYWSSYYGGQEGIDYIVDQFGHEIQLTACMQSWDNSLFYP